MLSALHALLVVTERNNKEMLEDLQVSRRSCLSAESLFLTCSILFTVFYHFPTPVNYVNLIKNKTCLPSISIITARIKKDNFLSLP